MSSRTAWLRPALLACALTACGGGTTAPPVLSVAGSYPTQATLLESDCTGVTVQPAATTVAHVPGASTLSVTHAAITYGGTIQPGAAFTLYPRTVGSGASAATVLIAGQFAPTGFTADVGVHLQAEDCDYHVRWVGTRFGDPNVIP
jgi:hypothetical protein